MDLLKLEEEYNNLTNTLIIVKSCVPYAIYKKSIGYFEDEPDILTDIWQNAAVHYNQDPNMSKSFSRLYEFLVDSIIRSNMITLKKIQQAYDDYEDSIRNEVFSLVIEDIKSYKERAEQATTSNIEEISSNDDVNEQFVQLSMNDGIALNAPDTKFIANDMEILPASSIQSIIKKPTEENPSKELIEYKEFPSLILEEGTLLANSSNMFASLVTVLTANNAFEEKENGDLEAVIKNKKGEVVTKASIRRDLVFLNDKKQNEIWNRLIQQIDKFDELTADLLDLISSMWLVQKKDDYGFITLDSRVILPILMPNKKYFREVDHFSIMERITILSNTLLARRDETAELNKKEIKKNLNIEDDDVEFKIYQKMFEIDDIRVVTKKSKHQPLGIYSLKIKPAPVLSEWFSSPNPSFRVLDLKVIQYHRVKEREFKRLGRYLSFQWKIRLVNRNLMQPFKVQTLLEKINISKRYVGAPLVDRFEEILDRLQEDGIIRSWCYVNPPTEKEKAVRGYIKYRWPELLVKIEPPTKILESHLKMLRSEKVIDVNAEEVTKLLAQETEELNFDSESVRLEMKRRDLSIRAAASEIGIGVASLSRYLNGKARLQERNLKKIHLWLKNKSM